MDLTTQRTAAGQCSLGVLASPSASTEVTAPRRIRGKKEKVRSPLDRLRKQKAVERAENARFLSREK